MAFVFPPGPTGGQVYTPNRSYVYNSTRGAWQKRAGTAMTFNRVVNGSMQISQENVNTGGTVTGYYSADQWFVGKGAGVTATSAGSSRSQALVSANGSPNSINLTASGSQGTLGVNDYFALVQKVEGNRIADLNWGTTNAVSAVLRLSIYGNGAFSVSASLRNAAFTQSFSALLTTVSGTFTDYAIPIPGPTSGVWPMDNSAALEIWVTLSAGSSLINTSNNAWNSNGCIAALGQDQTITGGRGIWLTDVGLYADPNNTGLAPPYQCTLYEDDLRDCQRYFHRVTTLTGVVTSATTIRCSQNFPVYMRAVPTLNYVGSIRAYDGGVVPLVTGVTNTGTTQQHMDVSITATGGGLSIGRSGGILCDQVETNYIWVGARM